MDIIIKEYKNYKALCNENGLEVKSGNGKISQIKEVARLYNFHKEGNKIIIDGKKDNPKEKIDGRTISEVGNRINNGANKYIDDLMPLILNYISDKEFIEMTTSKLLCVLEIINNDYRGIFNNPKVVEYNIQKKYIINVTDKSLEDFYNITNKLIKSSINSALNKLSKQGKIKYEIITYYKLEDDKTIYVINDKIEKIVKESQNFTLDDLAEKEIIKEPNFNFIKTIKQHRKYNNTFKSCLLEDSITDVWQLIHIEPIEHFTLNDIKRKQHINSLRNKYSEQVSKYTNNIKYAKKEQESFTDNITYRIVGYVIPYNMEKNITGWWRMKAIICYMFNIDCNIEEYFFSNMPESEKCLMDLFNNKREDYIPKIILEHEKKMVQ